MFVVLMRRNSRKCSRGHDPPPPLATGLSRATLPRFQFFSLATFLLLLIREKGAGFGGRQILSNGLKVQYKNIKCSTKIRYGFLRLFFILSVLLFLHFCLKVYSSNVKSFEGRSKSIGPTYNFSRFFRPSASKIPVLFVHHWENPHFII